MQTEIAIVDLQKVLGVMFKDFVQVLEENKVPYYIAGGTLLGAVRHKGFIPWDDDVDISIPRSEYETFIKNAKKMLPNHYALETIYDNDTFPYHFAKLYDKRTTLVSHRSQPFARGVYIDIFPLDGISSDKKNQTRNIKSMRLLLKIYRRVFTIKVKSPHFSHRIVHNFLSPLVKIFFSKKQILKRIDSLARQLSWEDSEYIVNYFGAWRAKEIHKKTWYTERVKLDFNDFKAYGPKDYDKVLNCLYGDYMKLPPLEKRKTHHKVQYLNLNLPYEKYLKNKDV